MSKKASLVDSLVATAPNAPHFVNAGGTHAQPMWWLYLAGLAATASGGRNRSGDRNTCNRRMLGWVKHGKQRPGKQRHGKRHGKQRALHGMRAPLTRWEVVGTGSLQDGGAAVAAKQLLAHTRLAQSCGTCRRHSHAGRL